MMMMFMIFQLLKKPGGHGRESNRIVEKIEEDWTRVVKKTKRKFSSSNFSKRSYIVHECALQSNKMKRH